MRDGENIGFLPKMHKASDKICLVCFLRGRDQVGKILSGEIIIFFITRKFAKLRRCNSLDHYLVQTSAFQLREGNVRDMSEKNVFSWNVVSLAC